MRRIGFILAVLMLSMASLSAKPKVMILATGGTIAGAGASAEGSAYQPGQIGVQTLIDAVPQIKNVADVSGEQFCNMASQDMNNDIWLALAKRVNQLLCSEGYDGVVITHGTDTMEETAYFLNLTVHSDKPVVLTGSMRPSTALGADGPANLYASVVTAASSLSKGRGVLLCLNDYIFDARDVMKTHTTNPATFQSGNYGKVGYVYNGEPIYNRTVSTVHTINSEFSVDTLTQLPQVGIVCSYAGASALPMQALVDAKYDGIVIAGVGDGNCYKDMFDTAVKARKKGISIVRSSRIPFGPTCLNGEVDDAKYGFVASLMLSPQKARILLMLALTKTHDWQKIQDYFQRY